jgi:hypothetical protein
MVHTRIDSVEKSAAVVAEATGRTCNLNDPKLKQNLEQARRFRRRQQATKERKWNMAMHGMADHIAITADLNDRLNLQFEFAQLSASAGLLEEALVIVGNLEASVGPANPVVMEEKGKILCRLGQFNEVDTLIKQARQLSGRRGIVIQANLTKCKKDAMRDASTDQQPRRIDGYALWTLKKVTPMSKHCALFQFESSDKRRGTPYKRGRGRTMWHKTWHTTLLAQVGPNDEGPLPWVERDYTPISNWLDWENGQCDIVMKIYEDGLATSWLHKQPVGSSVWMSQPEKTMNVPSLVTDNTKPGVTGVKHAGILLVLAGTGIVVAAQVLQHANSATCFGSSRQARPPLTATISLIYACRQDDVAMLDYLLEWSAVPGGSSECLVVTGLRRCMLVITPPSESETTLPYPDYASKDLGPLQNLASVSILNSRLDRKVLEGELKKCRMLGPTKVVVSGPESFNAAMKGFLDSLLTAQELDAGGSTILSA